MSTAKSAYCLFKKKEKKKTLESFCVCEQSIVSGWLKMKNNQIIALFIFVLLGWGTNSTVKIHWTFCKAFCKYYFINLL